MSAHENWEIEDGINGLHNAWGVSVNGDLITDDTVGISRELAERIARLPELEAIERRCRGDGQAAVAMIESVARRLDMIDLARAAQLHDRAAAIRSTIIQDGFGVVTIGGESHATHDSLGMGVLFRPRRRSSEGGAA